MSDTPRTDDLARGNHVVPTEFAKDLERELNESRDDAEHWKIELEIVEARLCGWKHPRDEARELAQQMSESNQVLMADIRFYRNAWEQLKEDAK